MVSSFQELGLMGLEIVQQSKNIPSMCSTSVQLLVPCAIQSIAECSPEALNISKWLKKLSTTGFKQQLILIKSFN